MNCPTEAHLVTVYKICKREINQQQWQNQWCQDSEVETKEPKQKDSWQFGVIWKSVASIEWTSLPPKNLLKEEVTNKWKKLHKFTCQTCPA